MKQITMRMSDEDIEILTLASEKINSPVSSLYRQITSEVFNEWKYDKLFQFYSEGKIGLKKLFKLSKMTFGELLLELEKRDIEPPITKEMDEYTKKIRDSLDIEKYMK